MPELYKKFAEYYVAINNSRDYKTELDCILKSYDPEYPCGSFIELFAGQASHSIAAFRKGNMDVWAIDSSSDMKRIAVSQGFKNPDHYIIGDLPGEILNIPSIVKFDCVACLCYGLSNLNVTDMFYTLNHVKMLLNKKGKFFIEIHNIAEVLTYINSPIVNFEEFKDSGGKMINYAWPGGKIIWNAHSYQAEVPITLLIPTDDGIEKVEVVSKEHIYSTDYILFIANLLGYSGKILSQEPLWNETFRDSIMLELTIE